MKKILYAVLTIAALIGLMGCNRENQPAADLTQAAESSTKSPEAVESADAKTTYIETTDVQTEEIFLPPDNIDPIVIADKYAEAFQTLYMNYLINGNNKAAFHITNTNPTTNPDCVLLSADPADEERRFKMHFFPVNNEKVKCYNDLRSLFTEYCTEEFADKELKSEYYRDYNGKLYWADDDQGGATLMGCYINKCTVEKNKMFVDFIYIGTNNELFPKDFTQDKWAGLNVFVYDHDVHFTMTLVWNGEKWLIEDCDEHDAFVGECYRSDWTMSQNGRNPDGSVIKG